MTKSKSCLKIILFTWHGIPHISYINVGNCNIFRNTLMRKLVRSLFDSLFNRKFKWPIFQSASLCSNAILTVSLFNIRWQMMKIEMFTTMWSDFLWYITWAIVIHFIIRSASESDEWWNEANIVYNEFLLHIKAVNLDRYCFHS